MTFDVVDGSGRLKKRRIKLTIGTVQGSPLVLDERYRIVFDVKYDLEAEKAPWVIEIYNLSSETEERIRSFGETITLEGGYGDDLGVLLRGALTHVDRRWEPPDRITRILVDRPQDATSAIALVSLAGAPAWSYVRNFALRMRLAVAPSSLSELNRPVTWNYIGKASEGLTKFLARMDLVWAEQGGVIHIARGEADELAPQRGRSLIGVGQGMIGQPDIREDGLAVTSVLTARYAIGANLELRSRIASEVFQVKSVHHQGDTWSGAFVTVVAANVPVAATPQVSASPAPEIGNEGLQQ